MIKNIYKHQLLYWHLELSSKCMLKCPRCPRTEKRGKYEVTEMSMDFIRRIFSQKVIAQAKIKKILLCGGQGDPIYNSSFLPIIEYFKQTTPSLSLAIVTNGSYKNKSWWQALSGLLNEHDSITFSVDGWDNDSNNLYRMNSNFESILTGLQTMATSKAKVRWSTIVFRFNQNHINTIKAIAQENGADFFDVTISNLFGSRWPHYVDQHIGYDPLEPNSRAFISQFGRYERFTELLSNKVFTNAKEDPALTKRWKNTEKEFSDKYIFPLCRAGNRGLYVDASGILYPCSWVSHPFGTRESSLRPKKVITWKESLWVKHRELFNLNNRSLEEVLNDPIWEKLLCSWSNKETAFVECEQKCLKQETNKTNSSRRPYAQFAFREVSQ